MEFNQTPVEKDEAFQCDHCEVQFKTRNGLKIHTGKTHKEAARSLERLRGELPPKQPLTVSPIKATNRIVPCNNCGEEMSSTHLCQEETSVEDEHGIVSDTPEVVNDSEDDECECWIQSHSQSSAPYCCKNTDCNHPNDCCLLYTSPSPRDGLLSRMPSSA